MEKKQINYEFKVLYALGILFVVAGHCGSSELSSGGASLGYEWFPPYAFHLGLFMFASGYFYNKANEENIMTAILHKVKTLVIPMYLWNFFYAAVVFFGRFMGFTIGEDVSFYTLFVSPWVNGHQFLYNMGAWYLAPLFEIYVINLLLRKLLKRVCKDTDWLMEVLYFAFGMSVFYFLKQGVYEIEWLPVYRIAYFIPFYGMGILYRNKLEHKIRIPNLLYFGAILSVQLLIITLRSGTIGYPPSWCSNIDSIFLPYLVGMLGIFFWLRIAKLITPVVGKSKYILLMADNAFSIMTNQFLGFMCVKTVFALGNRFFGLFETFSWAQYQGDIWYYYLPRQLVQWYAVYAAAGIIVPIVISLCTKAIKARVKGALSKS